MSLELLSTSEVGQIVNIESTFSALNGDFEIVKTEKGKEDYCVTIKHVQKQLLYKFYLSDLAPYIKVNKI